MPSRFFGPIGQFVHSISPLQVLLAIVAVVALVVFFGLRKLRAQAARRSRAYAKPQEDVTPVPTARQWLARETAMNDLPPPREEAPFETASFHATFAPEPPFAHEPAAPESPPFEPSHAESHSRPVDETIVFPGDYGAANFGNVDLPPPRVSELPDAGPIATILSDGLDELASHGDRLADAIRAHPVRYVAGALATGFLAGIMFPVIYGQQRVARLLERLIASNEELKRVRLEERRELPRPDGERREPERFRQVG